jgi:DNA replication protein DnaC
VEIPVIHGRQLFVPAESDCESCRSVQEKRLDDEAKSAIQKRAENRKAQILDVLRAAGVNVWDHGAATMDSFDAKEAGSAPLEAAREFLADIRQAGKYDQVRGLYLFGDTGSGKSHIAVAVARELLMNPDIQPGEVVFDHALRLIGKIQRTYSNEESADEVLNLRINAKLWILDDLGTENPSADVVRRLTEIFTERAMRPTLVTSNVPPNELEGRHPEFFRVVSRMGPRYFRTVKVNGSDRRFSPLAA